VRLTTSSDPNIHRLTCNFFPYRGSIPTEREIMKCEELLKMLNEYVDGTVDPAICEEFEQHMAGCNPCQVVVDNIRKTITLYKHGQPYELPVQFRSRLHVTLREKWKEKHPIK
jgi:anti-sigma factor RsiW